MRGQPGVESQRAVLCFWLDPVAGFLSYSLTSANCPAFPTSAHIMLLRKLTQPMRMAPRQVHGLSLHWVLPRAPSIYFYLPLLGFASHSPVILNYHHVQVLTSHFHSQLCSLSCLPTSRNKQGPQG